MHSPALTGSYQASWHASAVWRTLSRVSSLAVCTTENVWGVFREHFAPSGWTAQGKDDTSLRNKGEEARLVGMACSASPVQGQEGFRQAGSLMRPITFCARWQAMLDWVYAAGTAVSSPRESPLLRSRNPPSQL